MKNPKGNSTVAVLITVIITALIVGGGSYYLFNNQEQAPEQETPITDEIAIEEACYKTYTEGEVSFDYPCDWETDVTNKDTMSAVGAVVAPDGTAAFHYPALDFGLHGMELTDQGSVAINGNNYPTTTYEGDGPTLVLIEMGTTIEYNIMLAYESLEYKDELAHILETFKF